MGYRLGHLFVSRAILAMCLADSAQRSTRASVQISSMITACGLRDVSQEVAHTEIALGGGVGKNGAEQ
jgi:hypothetical protein